MLSTLSYIFTLVLMFSVFYFGNFVATEGKDERGKQILGMASIWIYVLVTVGFVITVLIELTTELTVSELIDLLTILYGLLAFIHSALIFHYKKKI
ncbi:hypothetical protein [Rossellomorea aquimaris]|uniref:Uncharacterized protein n=1 Tax=Rossellomorea aquimaris TaxID=189382 RepID=A0A366EKJ3_9BACI|nr:hypothetical protein [Rossellomorea aquimaris]RBP02476.1 hypothetical protein DET59_11439 [Rossellomorea aquimaris]